MDSFLLGHAVQKNGPILIQNLNEENQQYPENAIHYLSNYIEKPPGFQDPDLKEMVCKFISKKADYLFVSSSDKEEKEKKHSDFEDTFAKMPPLETFMGIPEAECKRNFFNSVEKHDTVVGVVSSVMDSGLVITLLCLDNSKSRDIDQLKLSAFCPVKELPKLFPNQDAIEGFQVRDKVRAVVLNVNPETEKLIVSMVERSLPEEKAGIKLALINEDEFPVQFRRKLHIRGLTFDELLHSILGFNNSGNIACLLDMLDQQENLSLMRGLHGLKIPEKDMAENLRKYQSQKMAHSSVAQGISYFKAGKQPEAIQCFNRALDIDKTNVEALVARGALYANNESFNRAIDDFEDALKINAAHANARKYLHDTLLAFGRSKEDIEKYQEAEELFMKAMSLDPVSFEAREALRFLHYRRTQKRPEVRRHSSPREERRSRSPDGFEQTAKALKKLIKGDDKRHRKKRRRMSSDSSSSASESSRSSNDNHRKRRSRSRDLGHRNLSPPANVQNRQKTPEPEEEPHQEFGVDPQSSFLSGAGASFSDIFRSSSQESDAGPTQAQPIAVVSSQYETDPYMYGHPPPEGWYGIPRPDQVPMYSYGGQYYGHGHVYPGIPPPYFPGSHFPPDGPRSRSRTRDSKHSRKESSQRSRSFSDERNSPRQNRSPSYEKSQKVRRGSRSPGNRRQKSRESNSPGYSRRSRSREKRKIHDEQGRKAENRTVELGDERSVDETKNRSYRSWSGSNSESSNVSREDSNRSPRWQEENIRNESLLYQQKRPASVNKDLRRKSKEGSSRQSVEMSFQETGGRSSIELDKQVSTSKKEKKESGKKVKSIKKKQAMSEEKVKTKKKKKEGSEGKKKAKKNIIVERDSENNSAGDIRIIKTETGKVIMKNEDQHVESSRNKTWIDEHGGGDIRRVVPKEDFSSSRYGEGFTGKTEIETKPTKRMKDDPANLFLKSKWDESPGEIRNSPKVRANKGDSKNSYSYRDQSLRSKRSNSREFEGIRIHITNDKFGNSVQKSKDVGVVEMFHVDEQLGDTDDERIEFNEKNKVNEQCISKNKGSPGLPDLVKSIKAKSEQEQPGRFKSDNFRDRGPFEKRTRTPSKRSRSRSKPRGRSLHQSHSRSDYPSKSGKYSGSKHRSWSKHRSNSKSRHRSPSEQRSRSRSRHRSPSKHRSRSRSRHRSRSKHRSRSSPKREQVHHKSNYISPPARKPGRGFNNTRPIISGRNKFTDSRSPSISPGRKVEGLHSGTTSYRGSGSYRGRSFRGRSSWRPRGFRGGHRPHRSRSRSRSRSTNRKRPRSPEQRRDKEREYDNKPSIQNSVKETDKSNQANRNDTDKLDDLENFYKKLKENKKKKEDDSKK